MNTLILGKSNVKTKTLAMLIAVVAAVALPQVFHGVGVISGEGAALGSAFLPMHIPVLAVGFIAGPVVGIFAGIISPLLSALMTGMPAGAMLPNMIVELAGYGLMAGMLARVQMPMLPKLLLVQIGGRVLKACVILITVYGIGNQAVPVSTIWTSIRVGLPGLVLQWCMIPLFMYWMSTRRKPKQ